MCKAPQFQFNDSYPSVMYSAVVVGDEDILWKLTHVFNNQKFTN